MILRTLTPFLSFIIAALLFIFVIQPQFAKITDLRGEITEYETATDKYHIFTKSLEEKLSKKTNRSAFDNEQLDSLVMNNIDTTQLLVDLEAIAEKYHMLFGNIQVDDGNTDFKAVSLETQSNSELATADISFEIVGSYEQFKSFLSDIEQSRSLFEVTKIRFASGEGSAFQQYQVTVRVFALPAKS